MIVQEILTVQSDPREELDLILADLCEMILDGQQKDPEYYGMVAACVICPGGAKYYGVNYAAKDGRRVHAERAAIEKCGDISPECMIVTTCSPCNQPMDERYGESCEDLISELGITHVYSGYKDPSQDLDTSIETDNPKLRKLCKRFADTFLDEGRRKKKKRKSPAGPYYIGYGWTGGAVDSVGDGGGIEENFADGKVKGKSRPGRVKRAGASCNGSVTDLRKRAKNASGEKAKMYHWCANMKSGRNKK
jgi:pyrimidine deaminase RibD-like protein